MNSSVQPDWAKIARTRWPGKVISGNGPYAVFVRDPQLRIELFSSWAELLAARPEVYGKDSAWTKLKELPAQTWIRKAHWIKDIEAEG